MPFALQGNKFTGSFWGHYSAYQFLKERREEGNGREGKGREGKGREGKGREGTGRAGKGGEGTGRQLPTTEGGSECNRNKSRLVLRLQ